MKAAEIKVGGRYIAKVSNTLTVVRVEAIREIDQYYGWAAAMTTKTVKCYDVTNESTGRQTTFRSAAKFRRPV